MEPITIFAASVGLICACRLIFTAAEFFGKGIYSKPNNPGKRDDWYCFFKTSDLLGTKKQHLPTISEQQHLEQSRRRQQRPRLQA